MGEITLTGNQLFWIIIVAIGGFILGWCVTFIVIRDKDQSIRALLMDGILIKILTVMLVVFASTILAIMGKFNDAVGAIFAGIVGYVLGTMGRKIEKI
jgi:hypothetical protein